MTMLKNALAIAERGWPVFPCHPKSKAPLVKADTDPETGEEIPNSGGFHKATTDPLIITAWWKKWPRAMIGVPTGSKIDAFIVDFDAGEDKVTGEVFEASALQVALEAEIGEQLPITATAKSPRDYGGIHKYFAMPAGKKIGRSIKFRNRVDILGNDGYVIVPPSIRNDGRAYSWLSDPDEVGIAIAPPALIDLIEKHQAHGAADDRSISARAAAAVKPPKGKEGAGITEVDEAMRKYGLTAMDAEASTVRRAQEGERNNNLNIAALKLGQLVAAGVLNEALVRAVLEDAAAACGLVGSDGLASVRKTIDSGLRKGKSQPRDLEEVRRAAETRLTRRPRTAAVRTSSSSPPSSSASSAAAPPPSATNGKPSSQTGATAKTPAAAGRGGARKPPKPVESDDVRNMRLAFFPLTDLGNAERFRERYKDRLKWCQAIGWLAWNGKCWSHKGADDLVKIAEHDTVRAIQVEAKAVRESGRYDVDDAPRGARDFMFDIKKVQLYSDKIAAWGRSSEAVNKLGALSKRGAPYVSVSIDELDADKMKINVNNGTLVVRKGAEGDYITFQEHDPDDLITKIAPVDFDKDAECPNYDRFLQEIQPKAEIRRLLHQWFGVSLTGDISEQIMVYFYGKGGNGKSVLVEACSYVAGDYGETVPIETFLDQGKSRNAGQATPDLAILPGVRMLRTSEPEKNSKLAEAMVKLVTGGEPIQARHLNRDFFKFYPQFKLTMSGNYRPTISGTDEGIWRRLRLVPFTVSIPKEKRDIHLPEKLRAEASGILNRMLDGLRDWCDNGLTEPEDVTAATAQYREASDPLGRFLSMCVVDDAGGRVQSSVLYQVYEAWCKSTGEAAWKNRGFSLAMDERGFKRKQSNTMWFLDIKLVKSVSDFIDIHGNPRKVEAEDDNGNNNEDPGDVPF